jgi:hypothetical protein
MDLDTCYNQHQGTAVLIPGGGAGNEGQCAQWADVVYHDVYGFPYVFTPSAKDWWENADNLGITQHFDKITDGSIKKGDFVVYGPLSAGDPWGHIDVACSDGTTTDFMAYDSNWGGAAFHNSQGNPILHQVHHADRFNQFILGSLRLKGEEMEKVTIDVARAIYYAYLGRDGQQGRPNALTGECDGEINANLAGQPLTNGLLDFIFQAPEALNYRNVIIPAVFKPAEPPVVTVTSPVVPNTAADTTITVTKPLPQMAPMPIPVPCPAPVHIDSMPLPLPSDPIPAQVAGNSFILWLKRFLGIN